MHIYPRTEAGMTAALIAIPLVGLFVWIFNSYRLGRFNRFLKPKQSTENPKSLLEHQAELEDIINRLHMIRVGTGYFEMICPQDSIVAFLDEMDRLDIDITGFSWWCHVTKGHEPCGMGGPRDTYGDGWYSEIEMFAFTSLDNNDAYRRYFTIEYPNSKDYKPCHVPAFSLETL